MGRVATQSCNYIQEDRAQEKNSEVFGFFFSSVNKYRLSRNQAYWITNLTNQGWL